MHTFQTKRYYYTKITLEYVRIKDRLMIYSRVLNNEKCL